MLLSLHVAILKTSRWMTFCRQYKQTPRAIDLNVQGKHYNIVTCIYPVQLRNQTGSVLESLV